MSEGVVVWIMGRPASGKSTFGGLLASRLRADGAPCALLDGDEIREALGRPAGSGRAERDAFYEALARLAAVLARQGLPVIVAATAHRRAYRERARSLAPRFLEIHVATPLDECERRDPKGLYARASRGATAGLPGVEEPFEDPVAPDVIALDGEDERALTHALALLRLAGADRRAAQPGRHRGGTYTA
jgi:adenylylsulfate kinase